ncbi:MAG: carbon starvation protein A, partial [Candidatus Aminicenantes bacterium]|nr:carbon starvation protein A [Candidatus Aminicenantes bacterium]
VVLGGIFFGAVHDYTSLFVSIREGGRSLAEVARKTLGKAGFNLFISFTIIMIVLVTSSFLSATAISLTSIWPLAKIGVKEGETFLKIVVRDGVVMGRIGGIASTSVIFITACSPLLGFLVYKKGLKTAPTYVLALAICVTSIFLGIAYPVTLAPTTWMIIISVYVLIAAGLPVWAVLQPRDFINVQILYGGIILMVLSLFSAGFQGVKVTAPVVNLAEGARNLGFIWPMMFITIACGAISGFHCLVAGGTTCKQVPKETDARRIGYNAMLLESVLAVCVLLALGAAVSFTDYKSVVWPVDPAVRSNPILGFSLAAGQLFHRGLGIPVALGTVFGILLVEGFVVTTLDSAVRMNRYLFEELWTIVFKRTPRLLKPYWINSGLSVILMWVLAYSNAFNALWPIFGTANQLLAALALLTVSAWLLLRKRKNWFTLVPAVFMVLTTLVSLGVLLGNYVQKKSYILIAADLLLFALAVGVLVLFVRTFIQRRIGPASA